MIKSYSFWAHYTYPNYPFCSGVRDCNTCSGECSDSPVDLSGLAAPLVVSALSSGTCGGLRALWSLPADRLKQAEGVKGDGVKNGNNKCLSGSLWFTSSQAESYLVAGVLLQGLVDSVVLTQSAPVVKKGIFLFYIYTKTINLKY